MIHILIPTTKERREKTLNLIKSIQDNTEIEHMIHVYENSAGGWVTPLHKMIENIDGLVIPLGTDVEVTKGWLETLYEAFKKAFPNEDGIAQPYDEFHKGELPVHPLIHSRELKKYLYKGYIHCFSDNELAWHFQNKMIYVPESVIIHKHFLNNNAEKDETYKTLYGENYEKDKELFIKRMENNFEPLNI